MEEEREGLLEVMHLFRLWQPALARTEFNSCWLRSQKLNISSMLLELVNTLSVAKNMSSFLHLYMEKECYPSHEEANKKLMPTSSITKQARLKQAKEEAEKEIAAFRAQMEAEFQKKVAEQDMVGSRIQSSGDSGANVKRLEQETEEKIHHLKTEASRISPDVVSMLLRHVTTVKN
ncbi:V-type proton ATPase subunit G 1 [Sesamum angolense]|uniref:V-type proton ATPase subunit G 1 n=1 Tax=Sesamum angolense TaxID=2727404 RepID=A0AAE2BZU4_9LAMI|nr:V-type proton ATPase subunit G 1 [Sesamum angolense]